MIVFLIPKLVYFLLPVSIEGSMFYAVFNIIQHTAEYLKFPPQLILKSKCGQTEF